MAVSCQGVLSFNPPCCTWTPLLTPGPAGTFELRGGKYYTFILMTAYCIRVLGMMCILSKIKRLCNEFTVFLYLRLIIDLKENIQMNELLLLVCNTAVCNILLVLRCKFFFFLSYFYLFFTRKEEKAYFSVLLG